MIRTFAVVSAAALLLGATAVVADAQPAPATCEYDLSPPSVVAVSGTNVVTATVTPRACDGAVTFQTVACIQMAGGTDAGICARGAGILPAQVFFQPYRPGTVYTSTGRGCASAGNPPQTSCQESGPLTATL
ncbi:hypothetical protein EV589_3934 [Mycobacterium sp. BK558]|jgi:hypothetical protein|uniref:Secreted protein n=2 Tax=Mycolicibacterium TaxID=1866885 RepID=A0A0J6VJ57_MYCCU|nr:MULTISPECIES: hypothetical protein [Mycolicibacterium]RZT15781.1 hypothetical protein EV589_3934 [Mycobacterium sp. BK558]KMO71005.1 hypothetical protein MCHUDSM44219_05332 [Mycolicibacterium chubuense]KMO75416.1 hypothetical protein MCHLDSM_03636 [Mycolicibacterium chlorophenolicum]ORA43948.1 hypothetical protein BST22_25975 [Mycolicibacterium chubuense]SPX96113.1 Uncharacterised protein [Mycolicibacterium chubuense]